MPSTNASRAVSAPEIALNDHREDNEQKDIKDAKDKKDSLAMDEDCRMNGGGRTWVDGKKEWRHSENGNKIFVVQHETAA